MYGIVPAPGGMLQELHVMGEHSRAVFRGIVGPHDFSLQCHRALQATGAAANEVITQAYTDGGAYAEYAQLLSEVGGSAVPTLVNTSRFSAQELHKHVLGVLAHGARAPLAVHTNTQRLLTTLQKTTSPVHLVVLAGVGRPFAHLRADMHQLLRSPASCAQLTRAMGAFLNGLYLVLKAGHVHGAVDAQSLRITSRMRICLHGWAPRARDAHAGIATVYAWFTATDHQPHQHPLVWMLTLCWYKWLSLQRGESRADHFVQLSLKTVLVHMAYDCCGEPCPADLGEHTWLDTLYAMLQSAPVTQPGMPWVVGVVRDVLAANNAKLYPMLDRMWTNAKRVFVKTFAESHTTYRKQLKAAMKQRQAEFPHSFSLRCINARSCSSETSVETTERMLGAFFSGVANLPIEVRGDREFVCRELCRWSDLGNACRELWLVLSACPGAVAQATINAMRDTLYASLQNTDSAVQSLCQVLSEEQPPASGSNPAPARVQWAADNL